MAKASLYQLRDGMKSQELDHHTRLRHKEKLSFFMKVKEYLTEKFSPFIKKLRKKKKNIKIFCCDNAGENKTLKENWAKNFEEIKFEVTSSGTPQKNGVVEREFATIYSRMCAMMAQVVLHENLNTALWPKCAATTTKPRKIMVNPHKKMCI